MSKNKPLVVGENSMTLGDQYYDDSGSATQLEGIEERVPKKKKKKPPVAK